MSDTPVPTRSIAARVWLVALGALAAAASAGCAKSTYLEIDFKGAGLPPVRQINLTLTDLSNGTYSAGVLPDGVVDAASTEQVKFPVSVVFRLNDLSGGTPLSIKADAISPANAPVAHAQANTTVMHAKTWQVTLDFATGLVVSLPLAADRAEVPAGGGTSSDAGAAPLADEDDDTGELSGDRQAIDVHFTR